MDETTEVSHAKTQRPKEETPTLHPLVELTMIVGVENLRSRFNSALGLASQGFSESCRVPNRP